MLVDEYQDIEPAQELLVRILAAPQDGCFCVGDEDQTLYGWRRASVRRMIDLDVAYPGLQRVSLAHNYRCPPEVVRASRGSIERNVVRFPKPIEPAPGAARRRSGALELPRTATARRARRGSRGRSAARARGEIVVLARTTNLLTAVALACVAPRVRISAHPGGLRAQRCAPGARGLPAAVRRPRRGAARGRRDRLPRPQPRPAATSAEADVAERLRDGCSFAEAFDGLGTDDRQRAKLADAVRVLDALGAITDAAAFVRRLRGAGGLDAYFAEHERTFGGAEQIELEVLEQAQAEASGRTVAQLQRAARRARRTRCATSATTSTASSWRRSTAPRAASGRRSGSSAATRASCPTALRSTPRAEQEAAGEGIEAERRLAYVAFTRAQERLVVCATERAPSRFLSEAGLAPSRPYTPPAPVVTRDDRPRPSRQAARTRPPPRTTRGARIGPEHGRLAKAMEVGLGYAMRTAPSPRIALQTAAAALEQRLVGETTSSERMTADKLLANVEGLGAAEGAALLERAGIADGEMLVSRLDAGARMRLASELRGAC